MDPPGEHPDAARPAKPVGDLRSLDALSPALSTALEGGDGSLGDRLRRIAELSPPRPRYTLLGEIGEGGMGRVLRVWDESLQRELAMKVVSVAPGSGSSAEEVADHERQLARFVEEARITGQLDHPGIVPVHEIAVDEEGNVYFTMPLVRGQTLLEVFRHVRNETEGWTRHRALDVLQTVCMTVAFAHSRGVLHRDLKPANIMVGPFGEAYVLDWGLARIGEGAGGQSVVGTPAYMAPEQASRLDEVGPRSDVYSLGTILYELLGGRVPHQTTIDENQGALPVDALIRLPPRPIEEIVDDVPPELAAICDKAMAHEPEDRYASAKELADDVAAWLEGRVVRAYRTDRWAFFQKWRERNRPLWRALEALAVLGLVSTTVVVFLQRSRLNTVEAANRRILAESYVTNLHAANLHLRALEMNDARLRLKDCSPELRGWEWRHLELCTDASADVFGGPREAPQDVCVSDDGRRVAGACEDGDVHVWNAEGELLFVLAGHEDFARAVRFLPGTSLVLSGSDDRSVRLWNAETGSLVRVVEEVPARVTALACSPDGTRFAVGDFDGRVRVRSASDDAVLAELGAPGNPVSALAFLGDGALAVAHASGHVRRWSLGDLAIESETHVGDASVESLAATPDGETLLVAAGERALALDARELSTLREFRGHEGSVSSVAVDATGRELLTGSRDYTVRAWEIATGRPTGSFSGHVGRVNAVAYLPDGSGFVSAAEDMTARRWSIDAEPVRTLTGHGERVTSIAFSADGTRLVSAGRDQMLRVWDAHGGGELEAIRVAGTADFVGWLGERVVFSGDDGALRLARPGSDAVWEVLGGGWKHPGAMAVHAPSEAIVVTTVEQGAVLWRAPDPNPALVLENVGESYATAFHPSGDRFAIGLQGGELVLFDARDGARLRTLTGAKAPINTIAFAHTQPLVAAGTRDRSILVWSSETGELLRRLQGHENLIASIAFSPDDRRLVSGSRDTTVRVWDVASGAALLTLREHASAVTAVAFSPDGTQVGSAAEDGSIQLYRTRATDAPNDAR